MSELQAEHNNPDEVCEDCFQLSKSMADAKMLAERFQADEGTMYDINVAIKSIQDYICHILRDVQQRKAKVWCMENLSPNTAFWLKDFCQKILPSQFREGQQNYFGKKGMSLHVDVFFKKEGHQLKKSVYFTALQRCDQGAADVLCLADEVLAEFRNDEPDVNSLYVKSDNASCYHGNFCAEGLLKMSKKHGFDLLRYDYNEPCKGKDQCDRESAGAKSVMKSFVDAGNDILSSTDIKEALQYGRGLQNTKIGVMEIDNSKTKVMGTKISNISSYHSIVFKEDHMVFWKYFGIGSGVIQKYSDVTFTNGGKQVSSYVSAQQRVIKQPNKNVKPRESRSLCKLLFCPEYDCCKSFTNVTDLETHIDAGNHSTVNAKSSMDQVKSGFVRRMKGLMSQHNHSHPNAQEAATSIIRMSEACEQVPEMNLFAKEGWALPTRSNFRFTSLQKSLLYDIFIKGEKDGKKSTPEQASLFIRNQLKPAEYVTPKQIKSLFSRWSRLYREGKLKDPKEGNIEIEGEEDDEEFDDDNNEENLMNEEIQQEALQISAAFSCEKYCNDQWVVVKFGSEWYPGQIMEVMSNLVTVSCMRYAMSAEKNAFVHPNTPDINEYSSDDVICVISAPTPVNRRFLALSEEDFKQAKTEFKKRN
eukprot:TCONS_00029465-protein